MIIKKKSGNRKTSGFILLKIITVIIFIFGKTNTVM